MKPTRNSEVLKDFTAYCEAHPEERFWQALRNWSGFAKVLVTAWPPWPASEVGDSQPRNTFNWEGKDQ